MIKIDNIKNNLDNLFTELQEIDKLSYDTVLAKTIFFNKLDYYIISITELNSVATSPLKGEKNKIEPMDFYNKENKTSTVYVFFTEEEANYFIQKYNATPEEYCVDKIDFNTLYFIINALYKNNNQDYPIDDIIIRFFLNKDETDTSLTSIDHQILFNIFKVLNNIVPYSLFCNEHNISNILMVKALKEISNFKLIVPAVQYLDEKYILHLNIITSKRNVYPEDILKIKGKLKKITNNIFSEFYINFNQQALEYASYYNLHEYAVIENVTK